MVLDSPAPAFSRRTLARLLEGAAGPARARVSHLLREDAVALLRFRRAAVYLPGLLGAPRLLVSSLATADGEPPSAADHRPSPLRRGALHAATNACVDAVVLRFDGDAQEPAGELLVVPLAGEPGLKTWAGSLVLLRETSWSRDERALAQALARAIERAIAMPGS